MGQLSRDGAEGGVSRDDLSDVGSVASGSRGDDRGSGGGGSSRLNLDRSRGRGGSSRGARDLLVGDTELSGVCRLSVFGRASSKVT